MERSMSPEPCRSSPRSSRAGSANIPNNGCGCTVVGAEFSLSRGGEKSLPSLDPGPQPVHHALSLLIVRADGKKSAQRRLVGVHGRIVKHRLVDEFLAPQIAVRVGDQIGILGGDLGLQQKIDESMRV